MIPDQVPPDQVNEVEHGALSPPLSAAAGVELSLHAVDGSSAALETDGEGQSWSPRSQLVPQADDEDPSETCSSTAPAQPTQFSAAHIVLLTCPGVLMSTLDQSVLDVSLVTISEELGETIDRTQWIVLVYYLLSASSMSTFGRIGDRYDKVRIYQVSASPPSIA